MYNLLPPATIGFEVLRLLSKYKPYLFSLISLSFFYYNAFGQYNRISFDHITVEDGLSQSTVFSIAQDADGFIWLGTRDGLNRFDSHEIKVYKNNPSDGLSLSGNTINSLFLDSRNQLWIGTYLGGVCIYMPETDNFRCFKNTPKNNASLSNNNVNVVFEDREKNIWIGTRNGLNLVVSTEPFKVIRFIHKPGKSESLVDNYVRTIYQDSHGDIWVGTLNGISRLRLKREYEYSFTNYISSGKDPDSLNDNWINTIVEGDNETIWIGTEKGGVNIYNRRTNTFYSAKNPGNNINFRHVIKNADDAVRVITKDKAGNYWIGTLGGLLVYNPVLNVSKHYTSNSDNPSSLSDNSVRSIFIDRNGSFWLGTYYAGLNFYSPNSQQFDYFKQTGKNAPLRFKMASAIFEDFNSNLWLSIDGGGIIYWNKTNNSYEVFRHKADDPQSLGHNNIKCIYPDGKEGLWIGTFNGLNYLTLKTRKFKRYDAGANSVPNDRIYSITQDSNQDFWIATNGGGLCRYSKKNKTFETFRSSTANTSLLSNYLTCLLLDSKNTLWIGSSTGVCQRLSNGKFRRFDITLPGVKEINGQFILAIFEDKEKRIWVGTRGKGLFRFDHKKQDFVHVDNERKIAGSNIYGILEDKNGFLWLSTENGISRFDPNKQQVINYNRKDGLICKEFNYNSYLKDRKGYMYFGGYNGVVIFHPDSIDYNSAVPPLAFTKLNLVNTEVKIGDESNILGNSLNSSRSIKLKHSQNIFSIEFAVLNYINPGKNQYAYKLDGFEQKWNYITKPVASYMNLPSGKYTLLVKGSNNDGVWNEKPISLTIRVLPPPWKTWWAFSIYFALILLTFYIYARFTKVRLKLEQKLFLEQIENKKQNELHQSKLRFFTNISHEIRTPLTLIISPLENLLNNTRVEHEIKKQLQIIDINAKRLLRLINQLLDFRKQENGKLKLKVAEGNIVKFLGEIILSFQEYARIKKIDLSFNASQQEIKLWYDRNELEKVFFNLLSNAFKFTPEHGKINVSIHDKSPEEVSIIFEDSGHGISTDHLDKIFDRFYQVENSGLSDYGFGIGLALAKGIVELHKGKISVESEEAVNNRNGYSKFTVILYKGESHFSENEVVMDYKTSEQVESYIDLETPDPFQDTGAALTVRPEKKQYTILIADDNPEIRSYLTDRLRTVYTIIEAGDGTDAWNSSGENVPDIIISDVVMPGIDGIKLTSMLKTDERTSHIPVILLTARNAMVNQYEGLETGADEYITKPFNIHFLELKIRNLLIAREQLKAKYSRIITLEPKQTIITSPDEKFLQRLLETIEKNMADPEFTVPKLVEELSMSRPVLFRKLKALTDMSVIDLINSTRLKKAATMLKQKKMTVSEVSYAVGFADAKYFSKSFRQQYGKTPTEYIAEQSE